MPFALLFAAYLLAPVSKVLSQEALSSASEAAGLGWLPAVPVQITAGVDMGYDDNVTLSSSGQGSVFARENVVLTYARPSERTQVSLIGVGRFSQYFDVSGQNENTGNVTLSLTHNFSSRLSFYASVYGTYQNQPNFQSNVGPQNVVSPFFDTVDIFSLTYHWLLRFSTVTSYTFERVQYFSSSNGNSQNGVQNTSAQNRIQNTFSEEFQFNLTSRTVLVGEYRFEAIDYDTAPLNSTTNFVLAGVDHNLTEHLRVRVRGGESFRSLENEGNMASPYLEGTLGYVRSNHSLNWTTSYGYESPTANGATTTKTWRTNLNLTYDLTSRLSSTTGVYYHHDDNSGGTGTSSTGTQNSLDLTLGLRYTVNKHFTLHLDYDHTMQSSLGSTPGYSRNRYSGGVTYTY
ncbi:MAG TPA: outer membrane beta-barrel protein [Pyrinomonadaceae bacterium]|nr:outer membrane beta-barrel protein [Pyrinomonadaceae bacterium]